MSVILDVVSDLSGLTSLADAWRDVALPFKTPLLRHEWFTACAEAFCPPGILSVMVARKLGSVVAIAPLVLNQSYGSLRFELLGTSVLGELSGLLYTSPEALNELLAAIVSLKRPIFFTGLPSDSLEARYLRRTQQPRMAYLRSTPAASPWIPINSSWKEFSSTISSSWRSNLRRAQRRAEEFGTVQFEVIEPGPETLEKPLREFFHVESAGWKSRTRTALESDASLRKFFTIYARSATCLGTLRLAFLRIDGKAIAAQLLVECAGRLWVLKVGYDEAYARCSPGILLMHRMIERAFEKGYEAFELLGSNEPWMEIWKPQLHRHETIRRYPIAPLPVLSHGLESSAGALRKVRTVMKKNKNKGAFRSLVTTVVTHIRRSRRSSDL